MSATQEVVTKTVESDTYRIINPDANMFSANQFVPTPSGGEAFFSTEIEQDGDQFSVGVYVRDCSNKDNCDSTLIGVRNLSGPFANTLTIFDEDYAKYKEVIELESKKKSLALRENFDLTSNQLNLYDIASGNASLQTLKSYQDNAFYAEGDAYQTNLKTIKKGFGQLSQISVQGRKARISYGNYYYPQDLSSNKQDRIKFTMGYSEGTKIDATVVTGAKSFQKELKSISGSVTLPIVTGISDQSSVDWKGAELNPLQSFAAAGALDLFNEARNNTNAEGLIRKAGNILGDAKEGLVNSGVGDAINVWLAQKAVGAQNLLSRTTGAIVNPNLEMLFNAPQLRNFGFTFLLSPRDADEADQVRRIIRFFKQGMSVKTTASNVFLKAPNIFNIKYMTFNTDGEEILHPSINIIKTCALLSMDVQYTPAGTYMTYEDPYRTMTAYQLTMQFGELDPIYDSDYTELDNDNDTVIGY